MTRVICIEGLGSSFIQSLLIPKLPEQGLVFHLKSWGHDLGGIKAVLGKTVIIGHSLGGAVAVKLANRIGCDHLITLDPRIPGLQSLSPFNAFGSLKVTGAKVAMNMNHANYFGWFPGLTVQGATNVVVGGSHVGLPGNQRVVDYVKAVIE